MYCLCFYLVTSEKGATLRGIVLTAVSVGGLQLYLRGEADTATAQTRIGHHLIDFFEIFKDSYSYTMFVRSALLLYVSSVLRGAPGLGGNSGQVKVN